MTSLPGDPHELNRCELLAQLATLQGKLATLPAIEQAKGALMATYGLTADAAFELLRFHSQSRNTKLRAIAVELTTLLATSPTNAQAITQFDRLIDTVTHSLQQSPDQRADPLFADPSVSMAALGSQFGTDSRPGVVQAVQVPPPGITIAGNGPGLPLVYANDAFSELTGYQVGDVLGRNCKFLQGTGTDPRVIATLSRALHSGRDISVVLQNYRSDGSAFLNAVSISPIRNPVNQITHYIGTQIDVTQRKSPANQQRVGQHAVIAHRNGGKPHPGTAA